MIKAAIIGPTGYSGRELIRILLSHPCAEITCLAGRQPGLKISEVHRSLLGVCDLPIGPIDAKEIAKAAEVAFLCLPHTKGIGLVGKLIKSGLKVIDLSADFRLKDARTYEKWYKVKHTDKERLKEAVYGLPEIYSAKIRRARLVANPGCYPTGAILAAAPLVTGKMINKDAIIIDAKSGVSGAGKKLTEDTHFAECNEDVQGFVRVLESGMSVRVKNVNYTNFCDIGIYAKGRRLIIISAIDNLIKGASGQAVQNMNLMFDVEETAGLPGIRKG